MAKVDGHTLELPALASRALDAYEDHKAYAIARVQRRRVARGDAEAHRQRGLARLTAATAGRPTKVLRLEITNALSGNDYSAQLTIGSRRALANVILDTGSSTLAVDPSAYSGADDQDQKLSTLVQMVTYGTGGWGGPVVNTTVTLGGRNGQTLPNCPIAITSVQENGNFDGYTGIMGLAYNGLNDVYDFKSYLAEQGKASSYPWPFDKVWRTFRRGFARLVRSAQASHSEMKPYFDRLEEGGVIANKFAFYTLRSWVSMRHGTSVAAMTADPLNKGYFILGGGEEQHDLYVGTFSNVKVLHDLYYNTNLKSVRVDGSAAHPAAPLQPQYRSTDISNSIIDSGTSDLSLASDVYQSIMHGLRVKNPAFIETIKEANKSRNGAAAASLNLARWPNIYFTLEGENGQDVELTCSPQTYWQTDFPAAGRATFQISGPMDDASQSVLGLPLMNNYYTIFDRTRDVNGIVRFARIKPLS